MMLSPTCHKETVKERLPGCEGSADADLVGWGGMPGGLEVALRPQLFQGGGDFLCVGLNSLSFQGREISLRFH